MAYTKKIRIGAYAPISRPDERHVRELAEAGVDFAVLEFKLIPQWGITPEFMSWFTKYGVDFAVRKDKSVDPPRYLVFVRSKDADALDAICKEHQARALTKDKKPSVLAQLKKFKEIVAAIPKKVREKKQERDL